MKVIIDHIRLVTLFYIAFPLLPFFGGWVRLEFAIPLILLLGLGCFQYYNSLTFKENERFRKRDIWVGIAIVSFWLLFSGAGGMGFQFDDHNKNNTLTWEAFGIYGGWR